MAIGNAWPGNTLINHWLELTVNGVADGPTREQIHSATELIQGPGLIQFARDTGVRGFSPVLANLAGFEPAV